MSDKHNVVEDDEIVHVSSSWKAYQSNIDGVTACDLPYLFRHGSKIKRISPASLVTIIEMRRWILVDVASRPATCLECLGAFNP